MRDDPEKKERKAEVEQIAHGATTDGSPLQCRRSLSLVGLIRQRLDQERHANDDEPDMDVKDEPA